MTARSEFRLLAGSVADARGTRGGTVIRIAQGRIVALEPLTSATMPEPHDLDARNALLMPGFIDIHVHGGAGFYVLDEPERALPEVAAHLARHGVTGWLPTTVAAPWDVLIPLLAMTAAYMDSPDNGAHGAAIFGCHFEGPYLNPAKRGAQPEQFLLSPDPEEFARRVGSDLFAIKIMTLAPELPGALDLIRFLTASDIVPSIGHTDATYAQVSDAIDAGARHVTHCYNAMRSLDSREPGTVGAAFSRPELSAELIWDGHHVHPVSCRALIQAKRPEGVILISDGIPGVGMPEGATFSLGDLPVTVQSGTARLPDGRLAGSLLTLDVAFQNAALYSLSERAAMTSRNAAVAMGLGQTKGLIAPGFDADLVLLDSTGAVCGTLVGGRQVTEFRQ